MVDTPAERPLRSPIGLTIIGLLAVAFLALLGTNLTTFLMIRRTADLDAQIERTHEVRGVVRDLQAAALDAEAGQRGFLLTGRVAYLSIHDQAVERTPALLDRLQALTRSEPQQDRVIQLRALFQERYGTIRAAIDLYREGRRGDAVELLGQADSRGVTTRIRQVLSDFDAAETRRLQRRSAASAEEVRRTVAVNAAGGVLIVLAASACLLLFWRYIAALQDARLRLDQANRGLEETVLERTEDLLRTNDELAAARDRAETLLKVVNHRVGNSLQLVASMISLQAKAAPGRTARAALLAAQARIEAVGQVHKRLYTSGDVGAVALDAYLKGLTDELRQTFAASGGANIVLDTAPVRVSTDTAIALGVIAAELITNAVKYAYPTGRPGEIRVKLAPQGQRRGVLAVEDDGVGMGEGQPKGTGLGGKILDAMATSIASRVEYDPRRSGVRASIAFDRTTL